VKTTTRKKLALAPETLRTLSSAQLTDVVGGVGSFPQTLSCNCSITMCCK
jgi:hypothetical protein